MSGTLTVSGNEITDAKRAAALLASVVNGDMVDFRAAPDSSFGIRRAATNLHPRAQCDSASNWFAIAAGASHALDATVPGPVSAQSVKVTVDGTVALQGEGVNTANGQAAAAGTLGGGSILFRGTAGQTYRVWTRWNHTDASLVDGIGTDFVAGSGAWPTFVDRNGRTWEIVTSKTVAVGAGKTGDNLNLFVRKPNTGSADNFWLAHPMIEKGQAVIAPYVVTSGGSTATHAAARVQAPASLLDETQGWIAMRIRVDHAASAALTTNNVFWQWFDSANDRLVLDYRRDPTRTWRFARVSGGTFQAVESSAQTFAADDVITIVCAWTATQVKISVNGGAFVSAAAALTPALAATIFDIGSSVGTALHSDSDYLWFACGTGTLTDAQAAAIHAFGNSDKAPEDFLAIAPSCACTMTWTADTIAYMDEAFTILDPDSTGASRGLLPRLKVEIDVTNDPTNTTRVWTAVTSRVRYVKSQRSNRNDELNRTETGTCDLVLDDRGNAITSLGLRKRQWVRYRARWQNVEYARWQGLIEAKPRQWPHAGKDAIVHLRAAGQLKVFKLFDLAGQTFAAQRGDQRFSALATLVGLTTATVDTDTDTLDAVSTPYSRGSDALSLLMDIEVSEDGLVVEEPDGRVSFQGRHYRLLHSATPKATFGESAGQIPYKDTVELEDDDSRIANDVAVTPNGGAVQMVSDATSISRSFRSRLDRTLLTSSASVALDAANYLLNKYKDPSARIPTLDVQLVAVAKKSAALVATLLSAGNSDRFTWTRAASTPISEDVYLEGVGETIVPGLGWDMSLQFSPADDETGWVLGDSVNGVLGTTTRLVY